MKPIQLLSILTMSLLFNACNSESSSFNAYTTKEDPIEQTKAQLYEGYLEDSQGDFFHASVFYHKDQLTFMKLLDVEDKTRLISSTDTENTLQFDRFDCDLFDEGLACNSFELLPVETLLVDLKDLNGIYKMTSHLNDTWEMLIQNEAVLIKNDINDCQLEGSVTRVGLPYFELNSSDCQGTENLQGYANLSSLYSDNDTIELMLPDFADISSYWIKI